MPTSLLRGQVYRAKLGNTEPKYYLVVSNSRRNAALDDVLVVRLTLPGSGWLTGSAWTQTCGAVRDAARSKPRTCAGR